MDESAEFRFDIFITELVHSLDESVKNSAGVMTYNNVRVEPVQFGLELADHLNFGIKAFEVFLIHRPERFQVESTLDLVISWRFEFHLVLVTVSVGNTVDVRLV